MTAISSETELDSFTLNEIALGKIQRLAVHHLRPNYSACLIHKGMGLQKNANSELVMCLHVNKNVVAVIL